MTKIKNKRKQQQYLKELKRNIFFCLLSSILVIGLAYFIFQADILKPQLNEMTASYISFNNSNTTDMLKISDLKKYSDKKGKSDINEKNINFNVTGTKNSEYSIIVYPINKNTDYKNIKFYIEKNNQELIVDNLDSKPTNQDGGIIIYEGKITKKNKMTIRMWLTKKYHHDNHSISFEIKVKPR